MAQNEIISRLFSTVLNEDMRWFHVSHTDIRTGIQNMKEVYKPDTNSLSSVYLDVANYNDPAHRCAYLHKYAPFHTALVSDMLTAAIQQQNLKSIFLKVLDKAGRINICSLGGGPGSDIFGVILVLIAEFGFFQLTATIVDYMEQWKITFNSLIKELRQGYYGDLGEMVQPQYFEWQYIGHNLLGQMSNEVNKAIQEAHLVTMVKFVSAAACQDTPNMMKKIFKSLKPGALILYIDNAGGGFHQVIRKCANECNMITIFGPLKHQLYTNSHFNTQRFGYTPCWETKVTFHIWRRPNINEPLIDSHYIGGPSVHKNISTKYAYNQYNIHNTSINYTNINFPDLSENRSNAIHKYIFNPQAAGNDNSILGQRQPSSQQMYHQSSSQRQPYSIQSQPQRQSPPIPEHNFNNPSYSSNENNEMDCCSCCVIS